MTNPISDLYVKFMETIEPYLKKYPLCCAISDKKYQDGSYVFEGKEFKKLKEKEILKKVGIVFQNP